MAEERIISAVGTAGGGGKEFAGAAQDAMVAAIKKAQAEGVTEPEELRRRQDEARKKVVRAMRDAQNQASAAGITDEEVLKQLMTTARDKVMSEFK